MYVCIFIDCLVDNSTEMKQICLTVVEVGLPVVLTSYRSLNTHTHICTHWHVQHDQDRISSVCDTAPSSLKHNDSRCQMMQNNLDSSIMNYNQRFSNRWHKILVFCKPLFFKGFHFFHFCKTPYMKCLNEWGKIDLDRGNMFSQSNSLQTHTHTHTHHICNTTPPGPCTSLLIASHTCLTGYLTALSFPITLPTPAERNNYVQLCHWNDNATSSSLYTTRLLTVCGNYLSAASSQSLY